MKGKTSAADLEEELASLKKDIDLEIRLERHATIRGAAEFNATYGDLEKQRRAVERLGALARQNPGNPAIASMAPAVVAAFANYEFMLGLPYNTPEHPVPSFERVRSHEGPKYGFLSPYIECLVAMGEPALPPLVECLKSSILDLHNDVAAILRSSAVPLGSISLLMKGLSSRDRDVRAFCSFELVSAFRHSLQYALKEKERQYRDALALLMAGKDARSWPVEMRYAFGAIESELARRNDLSAGRKDILLEGERPSGRRKKPLFQAARFRALR